MAGSGPSWGLIERRAEDMVGWRELFVAYAPLGARKANEDDYVKITSNVIQKWGMCNFHSTQDISAWTCVRLRCVYV